MTPDRAITVVINALANSPQQQNILGAEAFAQRLATALDALCLLDLASTREASPRRPFPQQVPETPEPQPIPQPELSQEQRIAPQGASINWATTRSRT